MVGGREKIRQPDSRSRRCASVPSAFTGGSWKIGGNIVGRNSLDKSFGAKKGSKEGVNGVLVRSLTAKVAEVVVGGR